MAVLRREKSLSSNSRKEMCVETWFAMAQTVEEMRGRARKGATSSVVRT
jgi:hypothetical protein